MKNVLMRSAFCNGLCLRTCNNRAVGQSAGLSKSLVSGYKWVVDGSRGSLNLIAADMGYVRSKTRGQIPPIISNTGHTKKNGAVSKVDIKCISQPKRAQHHCQQRKLPKNLMRYG
jgi:hypothetical protein